MSNKQDKYLYWFELNDEQNKKRKFCILKPTRKMKEDGELYYASKLSQFISSGVLPKIVWDKIFKDNGGIISQSDQKEYSDLFVEFSEFKNSVDSLSTKPEAQRTSEENERIAFFEGQLVRVRKRMQELEMAQVNAFENTAEAKARNKTIIWWAATLGVEEDSITGPVSLLGSGSIEDKLDIYDSIIENDKFLADCFSRLNYLVTVWYIGNISTFEEFENLDSEYCKRLKEESLEIDLESQNSLKDKEDEVPSVQVEENIQNKLQDTVN